MLELRTQWGTDDDFAPAPADDDGSDDGGDEVKGVQPAASEPDSDGDEVMGAAAAGTPTAAPTSGASPQASLLPSSAYFHQTCSTQTTGARSVSPDISTVLAA